MRAGAPEKDLNLGPLINLNRKRRVERFFARAETDGAPILAGGAIDPDAGPGGFFATPRVYGPAPRSCSTNHGGRPGI